MAIQHDELEIVAACRDPSKLLPSYKGEVRAGDLRDEDYLDRLLVNVDVICHTAGWTSFLADKQQSTQLYLEPTLELINHAIEWRVSRFVNLSSLAATAPAYRQDSTAAGQPRSYWPMLNCLIAVEDYMQAHAQIGCTMVNLRTGIFSGERMNLGLLPLLIDRLATRFMTYPRGRFGYFPLIDGKDIGQAFVRAALAPNLGQYESLNITGPDQPTTHEIVQFLQQQLPASAKALGLPGSASFLYSYLQEYLSANDSQTLFSRSLLYLLSNPLINNDIAKDKTGFDPEISWQASLHSLLTDTHDSSHSTALSAPSRPLNLSD